MLLLSSCTLGAEAMNSLFTRLAYFHLTDGRHGASYFIFVLTICIAIVTTLTEIFLTNSTVWT